MLGHAAFAKALVGYHPNLVRELDSQGCSPLHLASANGYVEIVKLLLVEDSSVCHVRDQDGRTPLHLAVMKGRGDVIRELISAQEQVMRYTLDRGETILHLCVKHNHLEALKQLAEYDGVDDDLVNAQDHNGNIILHTATALKQMETIKYLLSRTGVKANAVNGNGLTALDIIEHMPRDLKTMEILLLLVNAGVLRAKNIPTALSRETDKSDHKNDSYPTAVTQPVSPLNSLTDKMKKKKKKNWLEKHRDSFLVAATLIAGMAYEAGLNPPGGTWQNETKTVLAEDNTTITLITGKSIVAAYNRYGYLKFWRYNTAAFIASLSTVLLLLSELPLKRRLFQWLLVVAMCVTMSFTALTYIYSMQFITPEEDHFLPITDMVEISAYVWIGLLFTVFIWMTRKVIKCLKRIMKRLLARNATESQDPERAQLDNRAALQP
ncbi:hypothetical protein RJ640_021537 [Escallonia rubra]|uniref:PGG domain-containing protein n=1 Tax=Escallonia rubra TaxID=112253 RepID=A0AA88R6P2_9ASTE|nr:hypothetical protein RJ640_021537 [Escallonia rubra]